LQLALSPASFPVPVSLQQRIRAELGDRDAEFDAVLDISADAVTLVGLALGRRVFTLRFDGVQLRETRSRVLPREVQGRDVLSDLQLALWPLGAVQAGLPPEWTVSDSASWRFLRRGEQEMTSIVYEGSPRWHGVIRLTNRPLGYRLTIQSAPSAP